VKYQTKVPVEDKTAEAEEAPAVIDQPRRLRPPRKRVYMDKQLRPDRTLGGFDTKNK
jgi:hypothetical protein